MIRGITQPFALDRIAPTPTEQKHAAALYDAGMRRLEGVFKELPDGSVIIVPDTEESEGFQAELGLIREECTLVGKDQIRHIYFGGPDAVTRSDVTPISIMRSLEPTDLTPVELTGRILRTSDFEQQIGANHQPVFPNEVSRMIGALLRGSLEV